MEEELKYLSKEQIDEILNFIDENFSMNYNKDDQFENIFNLSKFLKVKKYNISEVDADILLEKSCKLNILFSCLLKLDGFSRVLKIDNVSILADAYCLKEDIVFNIKEEKNNKDLSLFTIYINDLSQYKRLTSEEEYELAVKSLNGDIEARNLLIAHNLKLVLFLAYKFSDPNVSLLDLIQFGNEGLIVAANRFDPYKGVKFSTYAAYYIKQYISRGILNTNRVIRVPVNMQLEFFKLKRATSNYLIESGGIMPSDSELALMLEVSEGRIKYLKEHMKSVLSLSSSVFYDEDKTILLDSIEDPSPSLDEQVNVEYLKKLVEKLKFHLSIREENIINLLFGFHDEEMTLDSVGYIYGLTRERVRQIKNHSLKRMRNVYDVMSDYDRDSYKTYL